MRLESEIKHSNQKRESFIKIINDLSNKNENPSLTTTATNENPSLTKIIKKLSDNISINNDDGLQILELTQQSNEYIQKTIRLEKLELEKLQKALAKNENRKNKIIARINTLKQLT